MENGSVDEDLLPLLQTLNSKEDYYTASSCSGRVVLLNLPRIGDKEHAQFIAKWHTCIDAGALKHYLEQHYTGLVFLMLQSPILHVGARSVEHALRLRNIAVEAGFKYSSFKSMSKSKIIVELLSTERLDMPVFINGSRTLCQDSVPVLVKLINSMLERAKKKLSILKDKTDIL